MRGSLFQLLFLLVWVTTSATAPQERLLNYSIVGSASSDKSPSFGKVIVHLEVQRLLLELSSVPREVSCVDSILQGSGASREDLENLKLIRCDHDRCFLNFTLFTATDVQKVREVSEWYSSSLAAGFLARRAEIENALQQYSCPGVDRKAVAFVVLGCFSLDWDGLDLTVREGYRLATSKRPDGKYVPYAEERTTMSREGIYWGSNSDRYNNVGLTSFGDHYSLPRRAFPDFLRSLGESKPDGELPEMLKASTPGKTQDKSKTAAQQLGSLMFALRDRERAIGELVQITSISQGEVTAWLDLLSEMDYVARFNGSCRLEIPVFTKQDHGMIAQLRKIGREIMDAWLKANYEKIKDELSHTAPVKYGVAYAEGFTMIWHFIFGITNRQLVQAGLFADPYADTRKCKGFIPTVYDADAL